MGCDNSSNGTWPGRLQYTAQTSVPLTILVAILILLTVFGNVLVVIAVFTSRTLRAPQNLFLVSLACADILVATLVIPFSLSNELLGRWSFGKVWCEIYLALDVLFCTSSIVHLCAISLDRYWSVTQPIEYNQKRTPRRVKCMVLIVWVLAAIISCPPLISVEKKLAEVEEGNTCRLNNEKWYVLFSSTASFFAPCVIMILVYMKIYQVAKKRSRALPGERRRDNGSSDERQYGLVQTHLPAAQGREGEEGREGVEEGEDINGVHLEEEFFSDENNPCSIKTKRSSDQTQTAKVKPGKRSLTGAMQPCEKVSRWRGRQNREKRFTFVLAVVMGVFVVCWFPFFFTYTLEALCGSCCVPQTLFKVFFWFGYCNSSLNPLIYTVFNNDFRRSFKRILCNRDRRGVWV